MSFRDYIANVASSEVYPTWPIEALKANIHCQISLALNRIYTEWYPSKGYTFNITNSTSYDQYYVHGRTVFDVMVKLTDDIFNTYIRKTGTVTTNLTTPNTVTESPSPARGSSSGARSRWQIRAAMP